MSKIGLITYYGDNFGACMQAYALQTVLTRISGDCEIIACPEGVPNVENKHNKIRFIKNALKALFTGKFVSRYRTRKFVLKANKNINIRCTDFRGKYLKLAKNGFQSWEDFYKGTLDYNTYVCGSDQIWNPTFYGQCHPIYYLDFVPDNKVKVAYAPSVGIKNIDDKYKEQLRKYLSSFNAISVRETNAIDLLQPYYDKEIQWVLDPTLLLDEKDYNKLSFDVDIPKKPYIFCYLFGQKKNTAKIKKIISKRLGLPVVSIPFVDREILSSDIKLDDVGPVDFINLIKNATCVITDSFHATAFSINFKVPFVSLLRQDLTDKAEMSSRIYSILKQMHLEHRLIKDIEDIPKNILSINFNESAELLSGYRKKSIDFLKKGLNNE